MIHTIIFTGWGFMRWLRLGFGLYLAFNGWQDNDMMAGAFGAFFLFQAVTNTGCCAASGCAVPQNKSAKTSTTQDVSFEEIK